jgi:hypothetical protein
MVVLGAVVLLGALLAGLAIALPRSSAATTAPGVADGYIPDDDPISPFGDAPAVARLRPALRDALRSAARDARLDGVDLVVTSGWRDQRYQDWLRERAIARGGEERASETVAAGSTSRHLTGDAVDVGPLAADSWMQQHGARYGLCQIYANEMWHYELATGPGGSCPPPFANASSRP